MKRKGLHGNIELHLTDELVSPNLIPLFRNLGGTYQGKDRRNGIWSFHRRSESRLNAYLYDQLGWDFLGDEPNLVAVKIPLNLAEEIENLLVYKGYVIAERFQRNRSARMGPNAYLIRGQIPDAGGSFNNPRVKASEDCIFELHVPKGWLAGFEETGKIESDASISEISLQEKDLLKKCTECNGKMVIINPISQRGDFCTCYTCRGTGKQPTDTGKAIIKLFRWYESKNLNLSEEE